RYELIRPQAAALVRAENADQFQRILLVQFHEFPEQLFTELQCLSPVRPRIVPELRVNHKFLAVAFLHIHELHHAFGRARLESTHIHHAPRYIVPYLRHTTHSEIRFSGKRVYASLPSVLRVVHGLRPRVRLEPLGFPRGLRPFAYAVEARYPRLGFHVPEKLRVRELLLFYHPNFPPLLTAGWRPSPRAVR